MSEEENLFHTYRMLGLRLQNDAAFFQNGSKFWTQEDIEYFVASVAKFKKDYSELMKQASMFIKSKGFFHLNILDFVLEGYTLREGQKKVLLAFEEDLIVSGLTWTTCCTFD